MRSIDDQTLLAELYNLELQEAQNDSEHEWAGNNSDSYSKSTKLAFS